jgi:hypothetical protein
MILKNAKLTLIASIILAGCANPEAQQGSESTQSRSGASNPQPTTANHRCTGSVQRGDWTIFYTFTFQRRLSGNQRSNGRIKVTGRKCKNGCVYPVWLDGTMTMAGAVFSKAPITVSFIGGQVVLQHAGEVNKDKVLSCT